MRAAPPQLEELRKAQRLEEEAAAYGVRTHAPKTAWAPKRKQKHAHVGFDLDADDTAEQARKVAARHARPHAIGWPHAIGAVGGGAQRTREPAQHA